MECAAVYNSNRNSCLLVSILDYNRINQVCYDKGKLSEVSAVSRAILTRLPMAGGDSTPILEDHDGFIEAFYHLLWAKNFNGEPCPEVLVPDTIIYKFRIPAYWYFTGADGRLRRKNKASIVNQKIFKDFTAGARSDRDVVALHICETADSPDAPAETVIRYFDKVALKDFLFTQEKLDDGCLQKFVRPKGLSNTMIQAAWSPQMCLLERRVNVCPLLSGRAPLQERTATYEGSEHLSRITPVRGTLLADRIQHVCMELVSHIAATSYLHQKITRMLLNFKTDVEDNVWFLWCASVRVAPAEGEVADSPGALVSASRRSVGGSFDAAQGARDLAPVCLNPAMSSPSRPPLLKGARPIESVCPFTGRSLNETPPFFITYKTIIEFQHMLDLRMRAKRQPGEVPPLLLKVCPDLDLTRFAKEMANPLSLFLYTCVPIPPTTTHHPPPTTPPPQCTPPTDRAVDGPSCIAGVCWSRRRHSSTSPPRCCRGPKSCRRSPAARGSSCSPRPRPRRCYRVSPLRMPRPRPICHGSMAERETRYSADGPGMAGCPWSHCPGGRARHRVVAWERTLHVGEFQGHTRKRGERRVGWAWAWGASARTQNTRTLGLLWSSLQPLPAAPSLNRARVWPSTEPRLAPAHAHGAAAGAIDFWQGRWCAPPASFRAGGERLTCVCRCDLSPAGARPQ